MHFQYCSLCIDGSLLCRRAACLRRRFDRVHTVLILTGESRKYSDVKYIGEACKIARKYFKVIGLEVYPMNSDEYAYLHECGADYVTVFQESYPRCPKKQFTILSDYPN